jgi:outer membrane immunogenic protein
VPRFLLTLGLGAVLLSRGLGIAAAADLPPLPATYAPVQVFSWTGFYIGGNAGFGWTKASGTLTTIGPESFSVTGNGFLGGAQAGYNWQVGPVVLGAEADFQGTTASGPFSAVAGPTISATEKLPWFGTVRGRLGYAIDRVMLYATGGAVYGDTTLNGTISTVGSFSNSTTFWSWTAGAGVEAAFWDCWSARIEYLYIGNPSRTPPISTVTALSETANINIVRAGIDYHF